MEEEETRRQCVLLGRIFGALYEKNDEIFYDNYEKL